MEIAILLMVGFSTAGLWFFHDSSRHLIGHAGVRLASLALAAFLPVISVTAVVYAAYSMALFPFSLGAWSLIKALHSESRKHVWAFADWRS